MKCFPYNTTPRGFTLVETLVAITILLLVIIGPMTVAQRGIQNAYFANEQVTATFLAQEAIEAVRELRDAQALVVYTDGSEDADDWIPTACPVSGTCAFTGSGFGTCSSNNGCLLKIDVDGKYTHGAGTDTSFTRTVNIGAVSGGGVPVTVDVSWTSKIFSGGPRHVTLQTWVYDQYSRFED